MNRCLLACLAVLIVLGACSVLPADEPAISADEALGTIAELKKQGFPVVNFHTHLKGGLTIEQVREHSRKTGIAYGLAVNGGQGFPITEDRGLEEFVKSMQGQGVYIGLQAEGREWLKLFSKETIAKFDYVFTDSMTYTDLRGKRTRLYVKEEVEVPDAEAFMAHLVGVIEKIMRDEPIDIYANPTFLPAVIAADYDKLWTPERIERVVDAAVKNDVAIEINARLKLPSPAFIERAKKKGAKFSFGINNTNPELGHLEYALTMVKRFGLTKDDMFVPKLPGKKKIERK